MSVPRSTGTEGSLRMARPHECCVGPFVNSDSKGSARAHVYRLRTGAHLGVGTALLAVGLPASGAPGQPLAIAGECAANLDAARQCLRDQRSSLCYGVSYPRWLPLEFEPRSRWLESGPMEREIRFHRARRAPKFESLGEASYSIYLTHVHGISVWFLLPLSKSLGPWSNWFGGTSSVPPSPLCFTVSWKCLRIT